MAAAGAPKAGLTDRQRQILAFFTYETALTGIGLLLTIFFLGWSSLWLVCTAIVCLCILSLLGHGSGRPTFQRSEHNTSPWLLFWNQWKQFLWYIAAFYVVLAVFKKGEEKFGPAAFGIGIRGR
ncbi:hypothetical protein [Rhizobium terrae]|uniref:hypothetical protein n=1 Tax=Rhizobium terrae TaxID=2171756 RepID=UPI000E3D7C2D|nr:hypothetical protein [Rhizobium terrae]